MVDLKNWVTVGGRLYNLCIISEKYSEVNCINRIERSKSLRIPKKIFQYSHKSSCLV